MYKKLKYTFLILCSLICVHIFFFNNLYAMTQKEVGEAIATFALNFQKAPDGGQTWTYDYNAANRAQAYKGIKHSDGTYHADCVGWVSMCLHLSIGLDAPNVSNGSCGFVVPTKYSQNYSGFGSVIVDVTGQALMPGDVLQNSHHVMIYVGKIDGQDTIIHSHKNGTLGYDTFASYSSWNSTAGVDKNGVYTHAYRISSNHANGIDKSQVKTTWNGTEGDYSWGSGSDSGSSSGNVNLDEFEGNPDFKPGKDDTKKNYRVANPNDRLPIYKHILLTEKYNFNSIQWKRYGHGYDGSPSPTKIDLELGLKYPTDEQNTKLGKFVSLVLPYIQTWYIPLGMYSGILTSESGKMTYSGNASSTNGNANYSGSDNVEKVWNFLTSKGLSEEQTAAILGNMYQESGVNPSSVNSSSGAFGICQWLGGRKSNLANFANSENKDMSDITLQLDFLWYEISGENPSVPPDTFASHFSTFKAITDINEATVYFCKMFERCGSQEANNSRRKNKANEYYNTYKGSSPNGNTNDEEKSEEGDKGKNSDVKIPKAAKNINFPYSLIKNGYHEIIVNRYDLQTYSLSTKYKEYMKYRKRSVGTVRKKTVTTVSDGKTLSTSTTAYVVSCDSDTDVSENFVNTRKDGNGNVNPMLEDFVGSATNVDTKYYLNRALTFDMLYNNEFNYTKYKDEDTEARVNADSEVVVNRLPYKEKIDEQNRFTSSDMKGGSVESIAASVNGTAKRTDSKTTTSRSKTSDNKVITTTSVVETYTITGQIFTIHDGEEIYLDRKWEDKLSQSSSDSKQLDYDEMINFNKNEEGNSNRDSISKEEFEKSKEHEYRKYRIMGREGTINYIDYINSNPKLIKTYLNKGSEYSKYMGYVKNDDLLMSYNVLKKLIDKTKDDSNVVPYAYFISLGFNMGYSNTSEISNKASKSNGFGWPVDLSNNDGARVINCIFPYTAGYGAAHGAIDIAPGEGSNTIIAAKDGKIKKIIKDGSSAYGNSILIEHDDGYYTRYSHLSSINSNIVEGLEVKKGQPMGYMGSTGNSTGKHLDFEVYKDGTSLSNRIDPLDLYVTEPEYGSIDPNTITSIPSGYKFKSEKGGGIDKLKEYIRGWENANGAPTNADGTKYVIHDDGAGNPTVGYGVDIFNGGFAQLFREAGYPTNIGGEVPIDFVDALEEEEIQNCLESIKVATDGLNLKEYQLHALVSRAYNCGVAGATGTRNGKKFKEAYQAYWTANDDSASQVDYNHPLYTNYMSSPSTAGGKVLQGLVTRRKKEWALFQTGVYDNTY